MDGEEGWGEGEIWKGGMERERERWLEKESGEREKEIENVLEEGERVGYGEVESKRVCERERGIEMRGETASLLFGAHIRWRLSCPQVVLCLPRYRAPHIPHYTEPLALPLSLLAC